MAAVMPWFSSLFLVFSAHGPNHEKDQHFSGEEETYRIVPYPIIDVDEWFTVDSLSVQNWT